MVVFKSVPHQFWNKISGGLNVGLILVSRCQCCGLVSIFLDSPASTPYVFVTVLLSCVAITHQTETTQGCFQFHVRLAPPRHGTVYSTLRSPLRLCPPCPVMVVTSLHESGCHRIGECLFPITCPFTTGCRIRETCWFSGPSVLVWLITGHRWRSTY